MYICMYLYILVAVHAFVALFIAVCVDWRERCDFALHCISDVI